MIRLILECIFLLIIFVLSLILFPIEWLIGRISPKAKDISSLRFVQFVFKVILFLSGVSTTVIGLENIPKDEPVVFIGNHRGFFDTVVSYSSGADRFYCQKRDAKSSIYKIMDEIFTLPFYGSFQSERRS